MARRQSFWKTRIAHFEQSFQMELVRTFGGEGKVNKMKNLKPVLAILLLLAVGLSCKLLNRAASRKNSNGPAIDFTSPGKSLDVKVQLDKKQTASALVPRTGGSVSLTAADGSKFRLEVPADALDADTTITMTAVKSIEGAPLDSKTPTAVQLEPSGLFFKEMATLTIVPAREIPIKQQVIFSYEADGRDYHLAVLDPKSKDIKVKLIRFSGAGVGNAADAAWAANLMVQASDAQARIAQKIGEVLQVERREQLLEGSEGNPEVADKLKSALDQYEDQVLQKEMVAAELDCKHAAHALESLLSLERTRQLLGFPSTSGFNEKFQKLLKIAKDCPGGYTASGTSGPVTFSGQICSLDKPFVINGKFANGSETQSFTPSSSSGGTVKEQGNSGGCTQAGSGTYKVTLNEQGSGTLEFTETVTGYCPPFSRTKTYTFSVTLKPESGLSCP